MTSTSRFGRSPVSATPGNCKVDTRNALRTACLVGVFLAFLFVRFFGRRGFLGFFGFFAGFGRGFRRLSPASFLLRARVVGDVPAAAFELDRGSGDRLLQSSAAMRTHTQRRFADALDDLGLLPAL